MRSSRNTGQVADAELVAGSEQVVDSGQAAASTKPPRSAKTLCSILVTLCVVVALSFAIITPYYNHKLSYFQDSEERAALAGQLDFIVCGTSHAMNAFDSRILDEELGCCSYNLSGLATTIHGRTYLLAKELERNPVDTVILDVSYTTFTRDQNDEHAGGDHSLLARLDSMGERWSYLFTYIRPLDWVDVYAQNLELGVSYWHMALSGQSTDNVVDENKGFKPEGIALMALSEDEVESAYKESQLDVDFRADDVEEFTALCDLCDAYGVQVILVGTPVSESFIWCNEGWDQIDDFIVDFAAQRGYEYYDFNLSKDRFELFDDDESFCDEEHVSEFGAQAFSGAFCQLMERRQAGQDLSELFFDSYEEMEQHGTYRQMLEGVGRQADQTQ